MIGVRVEIRRYVDDHQPGWVECDLTDIRGQVWTFIEKVPVVSATHLDAQSDYPQPGIIACRVVSGRLESDESDVAVIDTTEPWGVESTGGETRFEISPAQLATFD